MACIPPLRHKMLLVLLDLSYNNLTVLPKSTFSGFIKLQILDLSSNDISIVNGGTFIGLNLLQNLDMSRNSLESLPDNVLVGSTAYKLWTRRTTHYTRYLIMYLVGFPIY